MSRLSARILVVVEFLFTLAILSSALYAVQNPHALHLISVKNQITKKPQAADAADKLADDLTRDYNANLKVRTDEVVTARVLAAQSRAQYNEYLYHKILGLADLERITAGGFCARLTPAPPQAPPAKEKTPDRGPFDTPAR